MVTLRESTQQGASALLEPVAESVGRCDGEGAEMPMDMAADFAASLVEGDTRLLTLRSAGALLETKYHAEGVRTPLLTVLWFNADSSGFMDETKGDRILSVDRMSA